MARPLKKRYVCREPENDTFIPKNNYKCEEVVLTVDEYETIRLIDYEGHTQEECSLQMHVSRTTVQSIYNDARKKMADCLVNAKRLVITGGDYKLCQNYNCDCENGNHEFCHKHGCNCKK